MYQSKCITSAQVKLKDHKFVLLEYTVSAGYEIINNMKLMAPSILNLPNFQQQKKKLLIIMPCTELPFSTWPFAICMHSPWIGRRWGIVLPTAVKSFIVAGKPRSSDRTKGDRLWIWMSICCHPHWSSKSTDNAPSWIFCQGYTDSHTSERWCELRILMCLMFVRCFSKVSVLNDIFLSYNSLVTSECHL